MLRKPAGGGEFLALAQPTRENALSDHLLDLGLERSLSVRVEKEGFN